MKRLIICADGTWYRPDRVDLDAPRRVRRFNFPVRAVQVAQDTPASPHPTGREAPKIEARPRKYRNSAWARTPSNVVKVARALLPEAPDGTPQIVYYDEGVGTGWDWVDRWFGGGIGLGLSENILQCYRFLVENYQEGDEIFLFGFSRGAFTVRSLAGWIGRCGLLTKRDEYYIPESYEQYRNEIYTAERIDEILKLRVWGWLPAWIREPIRARLRRYYEQISERNRRKLYLFRAGRDRRNRNDRVRKVPIKFIGVWDTVGGLGIPFDGSLGYFFNKKYAFHDVRLGQHVENAYHAVAIDEARRPFKATLWDKRKGRNQNIEQAWFAGYHPNIGGGLRPDGLANLPLRWIVDKAQAAGLQFNQEYLDFYTADIGVRPRDTMSFFWRLFGRQPRPIGRVRNGYELVHPSALERLNADPGSLEERRAYRPGNLVEYLESLKKPAGN